MALYTPNHSLEISHSSHLIWIIHISNIGEAYRIIDWLKSLYHFNDAHISFGKFNLLFNKTAIEGICYDTNSVLDTNFAVRFNFWLKIGISFDDSRPLHSHKIYIQLGFSWELRTRKRSWRPDPVDMGGILNPIIEVLLYIPLIYDTMRFLDEATFSFSVKGDFLHRSNFRMKLNENRLHFPFKYSR